MYCHKEPLRCDLAGSINVWAAPGMKPSGPLPFTLFPLQTGFLGEGDAVTKAIQDARQLLHSRSGALENSPNTPFRKVWATLPLPRGQED